MRLFHFSDDPRITTFVPRPVRTPVERPTGYDWLNGPLVWAIDEAHEPMYLFPRECPRILIWRTADTSPEDRAEWFAGTSAQRVAYIEEGWFDRLRSETIYRYELPHTPFEDLDDAGMWVSRVEVTPLRVDVLNDLISELEARDVDLRVLGSLGPLRTIWRTTLHASGVRLRNAKDWGKPA